MSSPLVSLGMLAPKASVMSLRLHPMENTPEMSQAGLGAIPVSHFLSFIFFLQPLRTPGHRTLTVESHRSLSQQCCPRNSVPTLPGIRAVEPNMSERDIEWCCQSQQPFTINPTSMAGSPVKAGRHGTFIFYLATELEAVLIAPLSLGEESKLCELQKESLIYS